MAGRLILRRDTAAIAELRIDNAAKFNAMTLGMWQELASRVAELQNDPAVRVLLLRGEGEKAFVSGADISEFETTRSAETGSAAYDEAVSAAQNALMACPFPVMAAVHGICMGGGLGLALACDLRYCTRDARFRMPAARLGLGYGFDGIARMVRVLGEARVAELFYTARTFDGAEAQRIGLVHSAHDDSAALDAHVQASVQQIAGNAPLTVRLAKRAITLAQTPLAPEAFAEIARGRQQCLQSDDYREGRRAFAEKRAPVFKGQ